MRKTNNEKVAVILKPVAVEQLRVGFIINYFETHGFRLTCAINKIQLSRMEIRDCYNLIGLELTADEERSWGLEYDSTTDAVFSFVFESEYAHKKIDELQPHKLHPLVYIKREG